MSQLKQTLSDNVKVSMKARELERVKVLRNVQAVIKQIEIDRQIELDDKWMMLNLRPWSMRKSLHKAQHLCVTWAV